MSLLGVRYHSADWRDEMNYLKGLFVLTQEILQKDSRTRLQKHFQEADGFMRLLSVLNIPDVAQNMDFPRLELCLDFLVTLRLLLVGSFKNRVCGCPLCNVRMFSGVLILHFAGLQRHFRDQPGYDQLTEVVLRCCAPNKPSLSVFDVVLSLVCSRSGCGLERVARE